MCISKLSGDCQGNLTELRCSGGVGRHFGSYADFSSLVTRPLCLPPHTYEHKLAYWLPGLIEWAQTCPCPGFIQEVHSVPLALKDSTHCEKSKIYVQEVVTRTTHLAGSHIQDSSWGLFPRKAFIANNQSEHTWRIFAMPRHQIGIFD